MKTPAHMAKHLNEVHFGGNWSWANLKDTLKDVTWQQANTKVANLNTILALVYHIHYYVVIQTKVMQGGPLEGSDKFSFDHPTIESQKDWEQFLSKVFSDAKILIGLIDKMPEEKIWETFVEKKYFNYWRNIHGLIEHTHYHLGQIVILKKIIQG